MAPPKNQTGNSNNNSNTQNISNATSTNNNSGTGHNVAGNRKTGTVPKACAAPKTKDSSGISATQTPKHGVPAPLSNASIATASSNQQRQLRKSSEIVAPIRRDHKDLSDYLLSTVAANASSCSTPNGNGPKKHKLKLQNITSSPLQNLTQQQNQPTHQPHFTGNNIVANVRGATSGYESENIHENLRFCFPVRPLARSNRFQLQQQLLINSGNNQNSLGTNVNASLSNPPGEIDTQSTPSLLTLTNSPASIPNYGQENQQHLNILLPTQLLELAAGISPAATSSAHTLKAIPPAANTNLTDSILWQRLQMIQKYFQQGDKKNSNIIGIAGPGGLPDNIACNTSDNQKASAKSQKARMVLGMNSNSADRDVIVNSASLEDVAHSEMSDNRAQSIQSLHSSMETPTPEYTPTYEELQRRLEASNRSMESMQEKQEQLRRLQTAARQHLSEMELLNHQTAPLSFATRDQNGIRVNGEPNYESLGQVQEDMAILMNRMKHLQSFIQNQNTMNSILGEDRPEVEAQQEVLLHRLEALRTQRDEMKTLVEQLQQLSADAEKQQRETSQRNGSENNLDKEPATGRKESNSERLVPIEYTRLVPIELKLAGQPSNELSARSSELNEMTSVPISMQKASEIETMKTQLKRLKDMMEAVTRIEEREIGRTGQPEELQQSDHERTPTASVAINNSDTNASDKDSFISRKMQMIDEVTLDLRSHAANLEAERDRINVLKNEIARRKEQAAAAVQLGEDALKRHSLTPTPVNRKQQHEQTQAERDQLKAEYEIKKKEFELLCQRLQQDNITETESRDTPTLTAARADVASEADDEAEEELNDSDFTANSNRFYTAEPRATLQASGGGDSAANNNNTAVSSNFKAVATSTTTAVGNSSQDGPSLEAGSVQSSSSQSYTIPPVMPSIGTTNWTGPVPPPLPTAWNPHFYYTVGMPPPPPPQGGAATLGPFTAQQLAALHSLQPPSANGPAAPAATSAPPPTSSNDCMCNGTNSNPTLAGQGSAGTAPTAGSSSTSAGVQVSNDPALFQQFVQTQQMLINSVCQCNQMLWHQQREIDALNNIIHMLQERLIALGYPPPPPPDFVYQLRSESVPPAANAPGPVPNNQFIGLNRAQSEQPAPFLPTTPTRNGCANLMQQQPYIQQALHHQQQQQQQQQHSSMFQSRTRGLIATSNVGFTYNSESQPQPPLASTGTNLYSTLNNAAPPNHQPPPQFNNETPQSPIANGGPGPIFMHHHNNSIHQNNANLRTQNHQQQHNNAASVSVGTLNNQVPPGNRANNYWDNFRSYSRQNLLSSNSNKSNEEQQFQPPRSSVTNLQQQQVPQQPLLCPQPELAELPSETCNNLNYEHNNCNTKCLPRSLQRSRINQIQQQIYQNDTDDANANNMINSQSPQTYPSNPLPSDYLENLHVHWPENNCNETDLYGSSSYNFFDSDLSTIYAPSTSNLRNTNMNMNVNFGNSPRFQRNKLPTKQKATSVSSINREFSQVPQSQASSVTAVPSVPLIQSQSLPQQQQTTLAPFRTAANALMQQRDHQQRYGNISTSSASAPVAGSIQNQRVHDYLLSTVNNADNYEFMSHTQTAPLTLENVANMAARYEEEDDTTSEEINRNLLVNALKNEKFSTKFYECIKEDVFRRLESILLENDNEPSQGQVQGHGQSQGQDQNQGNEQHQQHQLQQLQLQPDSLPPYSVHPQPPFNEGGAKSETFLRDPMRKLYWNARMGNLQQHQLQLQQQQQQQLQPDQPSQPIPQQPMLQQLDLVASHQADMNNLSADSNNCDILTPITINTEGVMDVERPEEGAACEDNCSNINLSSITEVLPEAQAMEPLPNHPKTGTRKRKSQRKNCEAATERESMREPTELSAAQQFRDTQQFQEASQFRDVQQFREAQQMRESQQPTSSAEMASVATNTQPLTIVPEDLISYIITRIRNQTHTNTVINDSMLAEISKLTANAIQNSATAASNLELSTTNLSPKKIYYKIRKLTVPRERDSFLVWYQNYLRTLFQITHSHSQQQDAQQQVQPEQLQQQSPRQQPPPAVQQQTQQLQLSQQQQQSGGSKAKPQQEMANSKKSQKSNGTKAKIVKSDHSTTSSSLRLNDTDLAEADQICGAACTSVSHTSLMQLPSESMSCDTVSASASNDVGAKEELENNENPGDEAGACTALNPLVNSGDKDNQQANPKSDAGKKAFGKRNSVA